MGQTGRVDSAVAKLSISVSRYSSSSTASCLRPYFRFEIVKAVRSYVVPGLSLAHASQSPRGTDSMYICACGMGFNSSMASFGARSHHWFPNILLRNTRWKSIAGDNMDRNDVFNLANCTQRRVSRLIPKTQPATIQPITCLNLIMYPGTYVVMPQILAAMRWVCCRFSTLYSGCSASISRDKSEKSVSVRKAGAP